MNDRLWANKLLPLFKSVWQHPYEWEGSGFDEALHERTSGILLVRVGCRVWSFIIVRYKREPRRRLKKYNHVVGHHWLFHLILTYCVFILGYTVYYYTHQVLTATRMGSVAIKVSFGICTLGFLYQL